MVFDLPQFQKDKPWSDLAAARVTEDLIKGQIDGCHAIRLSPNQDGRGHLTELLTARDAPIEPVVHVYQVVAAPGSVRAWIYHAVQTDRLCFTDGKFRVVLYDIRESSPTYRNRVELVVGAGFPVRLTIPPYVVHGVENLGAAPASYLNMPDRVYDLLDPDKYRIHSDSLQLCLPS